MITSIRAPPLVQTPSWRPGLGVNPQRCCIIQTHAQPRARRDDLSRLHLTYTTNLISINIDELAQLISRCAIDPEVHGWDSIATASTHDVREPNSPLMTPSDDAFRIKLHKAMQNSLLCVAAFAPQHLVPSEGPRRAHQPFLLKQKTSPPRPIQSWWEAAVTHIFPAAGPKVLVGFARAIGDAALVATVHDVMVLPELRGRGLGSILVDRLTRQLYDREIIDVGALVPTYAEGFFEECNFGDDSEESITMRLDPAAIQRYRRERKDGGGVGAGAGVGVDGTRRISAVPPAAMELLMVSSNSTG